MLTETLTITVPQSEWPGAALKIRKARMTLRDHGGFSRVRRNGDKVTVEGKGYPDDLRRFLSEVGSIDRRAAIQQLLDSVMGSRSPW